MRIGIYTLLFLFVTAGCQQRSTGDKPVTIITPLPPIDDTTACLLAQLAYAIQPQEAIDGVLPGWKVAWMPVPVRGTYAFVAADSNGRYAVCIRGSLLEFSNAAFDNWVYKDLNVAEQEAWPYADSGYKAKVARGAWLGCLDILEMKDQRTGASLLGFLQSVTDTLTPVLVTGHSLGGNLATVYATYLYGQLQKKKQPMPRLNVITFGAPAAGNKAFADNYDRWFPQSVRYENSLDMVPKFPCSGAVGRLGSMFTNMPHADSITVGYKGLTVPLSTVFTTIKAALWLLELKNGSSSFTQTNGEGTLLEGRVSGSNATNSAAAWFGEAGYQHSMAQYARLMGTRVIVP